MSWLAALATLLIFPGAWLFFFAERECERQMQLLERPWMPTCFRAVGGLFIAFAVLAGWSFVRGELFRDRRCGRGVVSPLGADAGCRGIADDGFGPRNLRSCGGIEIAIPRRLRFHTAILGYVVRTDGTVHDIAVAGSSGSPALDKTIVACVATLRFKPLRQEMMVQWK